MNSYRSEKGDLSRTITKVDTVSRKSFDDANELKIISSPTHFVC